MSRFDLRDMFRGRTPQERVDALHLRPDLARAAVALVADQRVEAEIVRIDRILEPDESVLMLVEGRSERQMGLLLLSTRRVLFRPHGQLEDPPRTTYALADLSDVRFHTGSMTGRVRLEFSTAVLEVDKLLGTLAGQFVTAVRAQQQAEADNPAGGGGGAPSRDPLQELVELRSRYTDGKISAADYEAAKARLVREL